MNTTHDDDLATRLKEIRSRHHSTWSDADMDDIETEAQLACLDRVAAERKKREGNVIQLPPRSTAPEKSLREHVEEMIAEQAEAARLKEFEASLDETVRELNYYEWARSVPLD